MPAKAKPKPVITEPRDAQEFQARLRDRAARVEQLAAELIAWSKEDKGEWTLPSVLRLYLSRTADRLNITAGKLRDVD